MSGRGKGESDVVALEEFCALIGGNPRRDVIFLGGEEIARRVDLAQIDGCAQHIKLTGFYEGIITVHIAQVKAVHFCGHIRAVIIPIEQVKGEWLAPQQVIIYHK